MFVGSDLFLHFCNTIFICFIVFILGGCVHGWLLLWCQLYQACTRTPGSVCELSERYYTGTRVWWLIASVRCVGARLVVWTR